MIMNMLSEVLIYAWEIAPQAIFLNCTLFCIDFPIGNVILALCNPKIFVCGASEGGVSIK